MQALRLPRHVLFGILALGLMLASGGRAQDKGPVAPATSTNYSTQVLKANALFNQDNQDSLAPALALVQAAIQSEPKRFEGYALEALIFAKRGQAQEARQALATAQELAPADKKERLTKVQAYVEAHAGAPPVASAAPSPEVQRKLNVLKLITDDADKAKSPQERRTLLNEFMDKSTEVLELAPLQTNIWVLRAVAAMELNQATAGRAAGLQLVRLGMDASGDSNIGKLMAQLDRKGWLTATAAPLTATAALWENSLGMKFVSVPGTQVRFCIWKTRVQDFEKFVAATGYDATSGMYSLRSDGWNQRGDTWKNPGFAQGPTHPVCGVNWDDAQAFCKWLTDTERQEGGLKEGQSYRLPTEVEWSQAVGKGKYPWGDEWPPPEGAGNYAGEEVSNADWPSAWPTIQGYRDGFARTSPVGSFKKNAYGLYDMGGNLWEWCGDWYDSNQTDRVMRGSSWMTIPQGLLSSLRCHELPVTRNNAYGFRVVLAGGVSAR
jgi:formylglycine-generating enzyme required for sulfatase activity